MIAGAAAMVAGGPRRQDRRVTAVVGVTVSADQAIEQDDDDTSPRTAKKVLPHFLAIGNPGSQALVAKEGAGIVQKQARENRLGGWVSPSLRWMRVDVVMLVRRSIVEC